MTEFTISVSGMSCQSCEHILEERLSSLDGVTSADADADAGAVRVEADDVSHERISQTIAETGYTVSE